MCSHRVQPEFVEDLLVAARHEDGPLAAVLAGGVLPLRLDALFEEVEVRARLQPAGGLDVVVQAAGTSTIIIKDSGQGASSSHHEVMSMVRACID